MFRHVVFFGLLVALGHSHLIHENDHEVENDVEEYQFVFPLDTSCAEGSGVTIEDFKKCSSVVDMLDFLKHTEAYDLCLAKKNGLVDDARRVNLDNFKRDIQNFGYFTAESYFTKTYECLTSHKDHPHAFRESIHCMLPHIVSYNMNELERKNFEEIYHKGHKNYTPTKKTVLRSLDAFHGILLGKSAPKTWVADKS